LAFASRKRSCAAVLGCLALGLFAPDDAVPVVKGGYGNRVQRNFIGVFQPATARWLLHRLRPGWVGGTPTDLEFTYGSPGDRPVVGDWDADGAQTQGVWRDGQWSLSNHLGSGLPDLIFLYGGAGDLPVVGDWDGDGDATPGYLRDGIFYLRNSNSRGNPDIVVALDTACAGCLPLAGDWDGDGIDTVGLYRPSDVRFLLANDLTSSPARVDIDVQYGGHGQPAMGDWNGDGVPTLGVKVGDWWYLNNDFHPDEGARDDALYLSFGAPEDVPVVGNWDPNAGCGYSTVPSGLVNFFPIGADHQPSSLFATWKARGINTMIRQPGPYAPYYEDIEQWTARASALGLKMIRDARPNPAADDAETGLLAWITFDEPDGGNASLEQVRARYQYLKGFNSRPVFVNFAGPILLPAIDNVCGGPGDLFFPDIPCLYTDFIATEDWVSQDYYPVNQPFRPPFLGSIGQITDKLTRWSAGKPQFTYLEASQIFDGLHMRPPTRGEFRAEVWTAIIHGARGIFYFPHGVDLQPDGTPERIVEEMILQNQRITDLAPVLQTEINPGAIGFRGGTPLEATWRRWGGEAYYIVLNLSNQPITKKMTVTGFVPGRPLTVVDEDREVGQGGNPSFVDSFAAYEIHIYRAKLPSAGSP
jgi:hypothetical protein